jgi:hypothetical protein
MTTIPNYTYTYLCQYSGYKYKYFYELCYPTYPDSVNVFLPGVPGMFRVSTCLADLAEWELPYTCQPPCRACTWHAVPREPPPPGIARPGTASGPGTACRRET